MAILKCSSLMNVRSCPRSQLVQRTGLIRRPPRLQSVSPVAAFQLKDSKGQTTSYTKPQTAVGSAPDSDIPVSGPKVAPQHAQIIQKGKQTFLKALVGESMLDDSRCWKDGVPLRPGVMYVLASGSVISFGTEDQSFTIVFDEGTGSNPLVEMMMKGMLAGSSAEVKKAVGGQ